MSEPTEDSPPPGGHSLADSLRHWASFPQKVRLLTVFGVAEVLAGVLLDAIGAGAGRGVIAGQNAGKLLTIPLLWIPVATVLAASAWAFLFAGAFNGRRWIRVGIGALWIAGAFDLTRLASPLWWIGVILPLVLLFWHGWAGRSKTFGLREFLVFALGTLFLFAIQAWYAGFNQIWWYATWLSGQFITLVLVAFPLLILTGRELGELADEAGEFTERVVRRLDGRKLAWLLLVFSLLKAGYFFLSAITWDPGFFLTIAAFFLLALLVRRLPSGHYLSQPPIAILAIPMIFAILAAVVTELAAPLLPGSHALPTPVALAAGAVVAAVAILVSRHWLDRRWPGAFGGVLIVTLWTAWLLAPLGHWGPSFRGLEVAVAAGCILLALTALRSKSRANREDLLIGLQVTVALTVIQCIQLALKADTDLAALYTDLQAVLFVGSSFWLWFAQRQGQRAVRSFLAGMLLIGLAAALFLVPGLPLWFLERGQFLLVVAALLLKLPQAEHHIHPVVGAQAPEGSGTFLYLGFAMMLVAVLGWLRALVPTTFELSLFHWMLDFGLGAVFLPLFFVSRLRKVHWAGELPTPHPGSEAV